MDENINNMPQEEEGIDIMALIKGLWDGRKTIVIWTCAFMVLGLIAALTMKRTYQVTTMMVPQTSSSSSSSSLSSLASLAGVNLGSAQTSELSPILYPEIVNSVPFQLELLYTPLHYENADTAVSMMTYAKEYSKPGFMDNVRKYTIGLPGFILSKIRKKRTEVELPEVKVNKIGALSVSQEEEQMLKGMSQCVSLIADKKEGTITLTVNGIEPIQTAELALKAQQLLQNEITRFRTEKAQYELDYIQARYDEVKAEAESYQVALATITDRSQNTITTRDKIERDRIQAKYNVANSIYSEMAKQLETAKMQIKKDTPTFTIIQPVKVPMHPSNSRSKKLIIWTFFGFILGCGIVLGKEYLPKLKEMFSNN